MRTIIVAMAKNNVIGIQNKLPWHLPEDLKHFKEKTLNQSVIMGRKTFESLPKNFRPLPKRQNIILTRQNLNFNNTETAHNLNEAFLKSKNKIFILGGESIYKLALNKVDCLEITEIDLEIKGDAFFPKIDLNVWELNKNEKHISQNGMHFSFKTYFKKSTVN